MFTIAKRKDLFPNMSKPHLFEGQSRKHQFKSHHFDARKYSMSLGDSFITEYIDLDRISILQKNKFSLRTSNATHAIAKLQVLEGVFLKYMIYRFPHQNRNVLQALGHIAILIVAGSNSNSKYFTPECLWKFLKFSHETNMLGIFGSAVRTFHQNSINDCCMTLKTKLSCFGEFLYDIATFDADPDTLISKIRSDSTKEEINLLDEISVQITPKLGILTYIVFRNWIQNYHFFHIPGCCKVYLFLDPLLVSHDQISGLRRSFKKMLADVRQNPKLHEYFIMFKRYLCKDVSLSFSCFDKDLITMEYLNSLGDLSIDQLQSSYVRGVDLLIILNCSMALLTNFLKFRLSSDLEIIDFYHLPEYAEKIVLRLGDAVYTNLHLFTISQLLNCLFVEQWKEDSSVLDFPKIWAELHRLIDSSELERTKTYVKDFVLFPRPW